MILYEAERLTCFQFNKSLYIVTVFSFVSNIFLLIAAWILCWGFRGSHDVNDSMNIMSEEVKEDSLNVTNNQDN